LRTLVFCRDATSDEDLPVVPRASTVSNHATPLFYAHVDAQADQCDAFQPCDVGLLERTSRRTKALRRVETSDPPQRYCWSALGVRA
jgi:hypothetical protein